jgi:hypothetical protein
VQKGAILSPDGRYRYTLERYWGPHDSFALFVMLNPSTADASVDDPTIRRCMGFARAWGHDGLLVWNLYGYRATDPAELDRVAEPIGPENEDHLWDILLDEAGPPAVIVAAWGAKPNRGRYGSREAVIRVGPLYDREVFCLGLTKDGHPRHPLYVRADAPLVPFNLRDEEARRAA